MAMSYCPDWQYVSAMRNATKSATRSWAYRCSLSNEYDLVNSSMTSAAWSTFFSFAKPGAVETYPDAAPASDAKASC
jgi:hypothetical protein